MHSIAAVSPSACIRHLQNVKVHCKLPSCGSCSWRSLGLLVVHLEDGQLKELLQTLCAKCTSGKKEEHRDIAVIGLKTAVAEVAPRQAEVLVDFVVPTLINGIATKASYTQICRYLSRNSERHHKGGPGGRCCTHAHQRHRLKGKLYTSLYICTLKLRQTMDILVDAGVPTLIDGILPKASHIWNVNHIWIVNTTSDRTQRRRSWWTSSCARVSRHRRQGKRTVACM